MFARTKRLTLRPGWPEDAAAMTTGIAHESVVRNLARAPWPYTPEDAEAFLSLPRGAHQPRFQIIAHDMGFRLVGGIELIMHANDDPELGYWLAPDAWGRGYATEAGRVVIEMARHALGRRHIVARHHADNPASGRVLRKLGFVETGRGQQFALARGGEVDTVEYALDLDRDRNGARPCSLPAPMPIAA